MAYTPEQKQMIALAKRLSGKDAPKVRQALLAAMAVESNFRNVNYGDRDSLGVLQQRPSQGWGPPGNPAQDIQQFLQRARATSKGFAGTPGQLAQAVQRSAFPERYDQRMNQVRELLGGGGGMPGLEPTTASSAAPNNARLSALRGALGQGPLAMVRALQAVKSTPTPQDPLGGVVSPVQPTGATNGRFSPEELFYDPLGAWDNGKRIAPIGGHSDHVHLSESNPADMLRAINLARKLGLTVRENPWVDPVDPVHTQGSFHYKSVPFRGRKMGSGLDVSGSPKQMAALYRALAPKGR